MNNKKCKYSIKFATKIQFYRDEVKEVSAYYTSTCEDMKHTTGITDASLISTVIGLHVM